MGWVAGVFAGVYGVLLVVALSNLLLIPRLRSPERAPRSAELPLRTTVPGAPAPESATPGQPTREPGHSVCVLIPARDEAENLPHCLPPLIAAGARVIVFDDESTDGTGEVAARLGALVVRAAGPPPPGWTGKNRACRELAKVASEVSPATWYAFLDADVRPAPDFVAVLSQFAATARAPVLTGFPRFLPGRGLEPLYLGWVPWVLLATNPFGLVSLARRGHNAFTNGQATVWEATRYWQVDPHARVSRHVLEDVMVGRLLAREGVPVAVADLTRVLSVRMYPDLRAAFDGMTKNAYEIAGSVPGSVLLALSFFVLAWGWLAWWPLLGLLVLGKWATDLKVGAPLWTAPFAPFTLTAAAVTVLRSTVWHRTGRVTWKGRTYPGG